MATKENRYASTSDHTAARAAAMTGRSADERRQIARYTRTHQWPMLQRFPIADELHDALLAEMMCCSVPAARAIVDRLATDTVNAAREMVTDEAFRARLSALPFRPVDRIVAVGDSITADRLGWFELLSAVSDLAGVPSGAMINLGVSGNTTADVLERFDLLETERPSHVLLMLGTNDVRSHGRFTGHRMATLSETQRNLRALVDLITGDLGATVTAITPPAVDQERIDVSFAPAPVHWDAAGIGEVAEVVRKVVPGALDLHAVTRDGGALLEADGVHPTAIGQRAILTHIVDHLSGR